MRLALISSRTVRAALPLMMPAQQSPAVSVSLIHTWLVIPASPVELSSLAARLATTATTPAILAQLVDLDSERELPATCATR